MSRSFRARPTKTLVAAAALSAALASGAVKAEPKISTFTLDNGMRGVVIEDHRAPVVTHMVWYRVGGADEPPGKSGIAHFLEHLMFKGTDEWPGTSFSDTVSANGGQLNAFTSRDYTAYHERVAKDRLPLMMRMEADRMTNLTLTDEEVASERDVVLEERSMRTDNDPGGRFREQFSAQLYMHHAYGIPVLGWRKEIEGLDREAALSFYDRFYGPENALLVVAGDVTPEEVEALAEKHYGPIANRGLVKHERPQEPPHYAARRLEMTDPRVRQPYILRGWLTPSAVSGGVETAAALELLEEILGGRQTSRLPQTLVTEEKVALYAGSYYWSDSIDATEFGVYAVPVPGVSLADLEARVDAVIEELIENGPTDVELRRAKTALLAAEIYAQDSQQALARAYGGALTIGLTIDDVTSWPDRIEAVTAEAVVDAAKAHLRKENSVTGWLQAPAEEDADSAQEAAE